MTAVGRNSGDYGRKSGPRCAQAVAERQFGAISRAQLLAAGFTEYQIDHWVRTGRLRKLFFGVYAFGHRALRREGWFLAAVLACGDETVLSHRSAAFYWDLLDERTNLIDVTTPRRSQDGLAGIRLHRPYSLSDLDHLVRKGVPVTTVARTLIDLAYDEPPWIVEKAWDQAEIQKVLRRAEVAAAIERAGPRKGIRKVKRLLLLKAPPKNGNARSRLEIRARGMFAASAIPEPEVNQSILGYEVDFLWRAEKLIVETDGRPFHSTAIRLKRDEERDRVHAEGGYLVLRFTDTDIDERPWLVLNRVRESLESLRRPVLRP